MLKVLVLGRSFTGRYLRSHFPAEVAFLGRNESSLPSNFEPDLILDTVPAIHGEDGLLNPLYRDQWMRFAYTPFVHVSSTSVYPMPSVGVLEVDENSVPGSTERCRARLQVEEAVLKVRPDALIVRSGGLYGPGRSLPWMIAEGRSRFFERGNEIISRIHVHDLCRIILEAAKLMAAGNAYFPGFERDLLINGVDPEPSSVRETRDYLVEFFHRSDVREAIRSRGLNPPESLPDIADTSSQRLVRSLYTSQFGPFDYPDYRAGFLDSVLRTEASE